MRMLVKHILQTVALLARYLVEKGVVLKVSQRRAPSSHRWSNWRPGALMAESFTCLSCSSVSNHLWPGFLFGYVDVSSFWLNTSILWMWCWSRHT